MLHFTEEQKKNARKADLYEYLTKYHDNAFIHESNSLRFRSNHSICIKRGYSGYKDFENSETGNSIDFLVRYMGYSVNEAILGLCEENEGSYTSSPSTGTYPIQTQAHILPDFPEPANGPYKALFAYLMKRGIPSNIIQHLIDNKLIYQSKNHNNIVFINKERDFAELHGTYTYGAKSFHGIACNSRRDGFWWFRASKGARYAYVCEAAIDAISLYLLHKNQGKEIDAYYISIAGVSKQDAINRIKKQIETVIAVDNDAAGMGCRERNPDCSFIIPRYKDWNEELVAISS